MKAKAFGLETFKNGVCSQCKYKTNGCEEHIDLCLLSEIAYYVRKLAILTELMSCRMELDNAERSEKLLSKLEQLENRLNKLELRIAEVLV
ncbi:hypothetical protein DRP05_12765 [Archaeoglobales archaeon]|nr:MAG: hypothetical protein DRP05_12765 [Archaeoglobales archaeon]